MLVSGLTFVAGRLLSDIPIEHIGILVPGLFLVAFFFSQLG